MAAANDNQGLKIAVAIFVTFTVILAVTTYFGFSNAAQAEEKMNAATTAANNDKKLAGDAVNALTEIKKSAGFEKTDIELPALTAAIKKFNDERTQQVQAIASAVDQAVKEYKAGGGSDKKVDELSQASKQIVDSFVSEPNRTLASGFQRVAELLDNQAKLNVAIALDNEQLRRSLESVNKVNSEGNAVVTADRDKVKADLEKVIADHNQQLTGLRAQIDQLQTSDNARAQEVARLQTQLRETVEADKKALSEVMGNLVVSREQNEKSEVVLDKAQGKITYVDLTRKEVRTSLTKRRGARPQQVFTIFDKDAPGQPTDRPIAGIRPGTITRSSTPPKATIELISVGETDSVGRIIRMAKASDPIRTGDQVYSPSFGTQQFALLGRMDIDRDGRDDREDLKRMIQSSGGTVDYDLAPSGAEVGKVSGLIDYYILDDRETLRPETRSTRAVSGGDDRAFLDKKSAAIGQLRSLGVRPMSIERLLALLNWSYGMSVPGRAEVVNDRAVENLIHPKGVRGVLPGASNPAPAAGDAPPTDAPPATGDPK